METLAPLDWLTTQILGSFTVEDTPDPHALVYAYGHNKPASPDADRELAEHVWKEFFIPMRADGHTRIQWRRRPGFQYRIPTGRILSMRANFLKDPQ